MNVSLRLTLLSLALLPALWPSSGAQTPSTTAAPTGVLRLRVRVKQGEATKGFARKRFFLIKGSLDQNKALIAAMDQQPLTSRDCYYAHAGATKELLNWLKENDCETVYCRELQTEDVEGPHAVPEFANAVMAGEKELGSHQIAIKWATVRLPDNLRDGFYRQRQNEIAAIVKQAETATGAKVASVMTDRNGTAYFTDLEVGTYTLTNIVGAEIGASTALWNCEVQVKPGDVATEKPYLISNRNDRNVKCVALEKPLPACAP